MGKPVGQRSHAGARLFQEIREKRGLAHSTYSFSSGHADAGVFGLYAGYTPAKVDEVTALLEQEWDRLAQGGLTPGELRRSIGQLSGGLVLGMEDTGSRMGRLGKSELVHGELLGLDESLERIRAVTAEEVRVLAGELAAQPRSRVRGRRRAGAAPAVRGAGGTRSAGAAAAGASVAVDFTVPDATEANVPALH